MPRLWRGHGKNPGGAQGLMSKIMVPHQGHHEWAVLFDDGEDDAQVYVRSQTVSGEVWLLTAPRIGMFFLRI